nr:alpha-ketoglutarate-dependent dioxygenase alkB homolog 3 [Ciona intestinalis]|eukprot:XP_002119223.1 alpha-ketoglutarate-dependent dioxygenase alkB homolog 3 [Ciona intestinalis]
MNSNRKARSRVQGSWAAPARPSSSKEHSSTKSAPTAQSATGAASWGTKKVLNKSIENTEVKLCPIPTNDLRVAPKEIVIKDEGEHVISSTSRGKSKIAFFPNFLEKSDADWMLETLKNEVQWEHRRNLKYGPNSMEPRLTAWFSEFSYSYSGVVQPPNPHWHPLLAALRDRLNDLYGYKFNSLLANLYRDGHDSVDWHTDAEPALGNSPPIASISFGDTRNFELREITDIKTDEDLTYCKRIRVPLTHGSLLLMTGATQHDWQHRVPKEYHDRSARVNLTFRLMHNSS